MDVQAESAATGTVAAQLIADAAATLAGAGIESARLDAEVLLAAAWATDRTRLYARLQDAVPPQCVHDFRVLVARRMTRTPLAYIVGHHEFWSLDFLVTPDVLIPRPETEMLVELALGVLGAASPSRAAPRVCDVGTGSGCIAVALAAERLDAEIRALDVSRPALRVAERNALRHGVAQRIAFSESDVYAGVAGQCFDVIICNPPYLSVAELERAQSELVREPYAALVAGATGLEVIRRVISGARTHLADGGWLVMEIGADQRGAVEAVAHGARLADVAVVNDHAGRSRVLVARR